MVCSSAKRNHVGSQDGAGPECTRPRESLFIKGVVGGRNLEKSSFASATPSGLGVPGVRSTYKIRCWWCVGVGDGDACSGRCGFRRVTTLGYGVSRWPSVEGAPRGLIGAPRIDPIT
uniref:Uncharacterized protein n=1 Tax=Vespula pensylvanica TaxID=30213 RepID=A0A834N7S0_VESPE|nr:hypothetical protein H0235_016022 [Vespula pensylvanica]